MAMIFNTIFCEEHVMITRGMIDCIGFEEKGRTIIIMCKAISDVELYKFGTKCYFVLLLTNTTL